MSDIQEPLPWGKSSATVAVLEQLDESEPKPPQGYVVSFVRLHERGFGVPVSKFMRALCEYYGVELHNFSPNSFSQATVFVAVCEGYLGIDVHWDLWIHLFHAKISALARRKSTSTTSYLSSRVALQISATLDDK